MSVRVEAVVVSVPSIVGEVIDLISREPARSRALALLNAIDNGAAFTAGELSQAREALTQSILSIIDDDNRGAHDAPH